MEWLNLHVSTLDSEEFFDADPMHHSIWLRLQRYCIGQENRGRIRGAAGWTEGKFQRLLRCSTAEVKTDSSLWKWDSDDLVVRFYPTAAERVLQDKRKFGKLGAKARWAKDVPCDKPSDVPCDKPSDVPCDKPSDVPCDKLRNCDGEGKGREGKGIESIGAREAELLSQAAEIVAAYPMRSAQMLSEQVVLLDLKNGIPADRMLAGTQAIAAVIRDCPGAMASGFVTGPARFFEERLWEDDPEVWRARFRKKKPGSEFSGMAASHDTEQVKVPRPPILNQ